jgi:MFS transporter, UMF1 family
MAADSTSSARTVWSWALYDWANSAFATTVIAGFFPIFFKTYLSAGSDVTVSTAKLGLGNSMATLLVGLLAPALGAVADSGAYKKRFLIFFTLLGAATTAGLGLLSPGAWKPAVLLYTFAGFCFAAALCFYDSFLPQVARAERIDYVSALGFALGYIGGGILFAVNIWMFKNPALFGLSSGIAAIKASFITVAAWWLLFTLPFALWVPEPKLRPGRIGAHIHHGLGELAVTFRQIRMHKAAFFFLIAFYLYNDGVGTTMKMAVDYGISIGLKPGALVLALLMVQFIGFPTTLLFGRLSTRVHPKHAILACIAAYVVGVIGAARMTHVSEFFALAALIGCVQGGIQSLSRSYFSRLIPSGKSAQFFGFYNLMGKFSGLVGPVLIGAVGVQSGSSRLGILSLALLFVAGGFFLRFVPTLPPGERAEA